MAIEDKFEHDIKKLIDAGKEKGYLTYDEVNDLIPDESAPPTIWTTCLPPSAPRASTCSRAPKLPSAPTRNSRRCEEGEDVELDLTPGALEKTNDPVRMYLREMGTVPLLTREGEVEIAKRIERGQMRVLKAISRSPIVIREILALGEDLKRGVRSIKEIVVFDEEELTEEIVQNRVEGDRRRASTQLSKHYKKIRAARGEAGRASRASKKAKAASCACRWTLGREQVHISRIIRDLKFTNLERKRLIDRVNKTVDTMRSLERQMQHAGAEDRGARAART